MSAAGNAALAGVTIMQTSTTGFAYPGRIVVTPLLDDGTDSPGNANLQSSALTLRQCVIAFPTDEDADVAAIRAAASAADQVTYVDETGADFTVVILDFSATRPGSSLWECAATLIEVPAGS